MSHLTFHPDNQYLGIQNIWTNILIGDVTYVLLAIPGNNNYH